MDVRGATALVSGANRGIGKAFVERLVAAGARRVYAGARNSATLDALVNAHRGVVQAIRLDVTDRASIAAAAQAASDVNLLVNNAGVFSGGGVLGLADLDGARAEMDVNYFGVLEMMRAFAPALIANAPSAIVNVLSIASIIATPTMATYSASKAASLAATRAARAELSSKGVLVVGVMPAFVETDMAANIPLEKMAPADVADAAIAALNDGVEDVYPGNMAQMISGGFFKDPKAMERYLAESSRQPVH